VIHVEADLEDEVEQDQDRCERCDHLLGEDCYGLCPECNAQEKRERWEQDACVCWYADLSGRSVCGVPCPVHGADA
jgi:hypothetical protein